MDGLPVQDATLQGDTERIQVSHSTKLDEECSLAQDISNRSDGLPQRKITNPFRLRQLQRAQALENDAAEASLDESDNASIDIMLQPPTKAVFNDLQSAHSSITSRIGRARGGTIVSHPALAQEIAGTLQGLASYTSVNSKPPPPSTTVATPKSPFEEIDLGPPVYQRNLREQFDIEDQAFPKRRPTVLSRVWNGLLSTRRSSTLLPDSGSQNQTDNQAKLEDDRSVYRSDPTTSSTASSFLPSPQDGMYQNKNRVNRLPRDGVCLPNLEFSSSPNVAPSSWLQGYPKDSGSSANPSLPPDSSTVGEIYRHYEATHLSQEGRAARFNDHENIARGESTSEVGGSSILLPQETQQLATNTNHESAQSNGTSYGDSQALLEVAQDPNHVQNSVVIPTIGIETVNSEHALSVAVSTVPSLSQVNWRNRYSLTPDGRWARNESRSSLFSPGHNRGGSNSTISRLEQPNASQSSIEPRRPLERDISQELRRLSAYSEDSIEEATYEGWESRFTPVTDGHGNFTVQRSLDLYSADSDSDSDSTITSRTAQADIPPPPAPPSPAFYNTNVILDDWVGSDQDIRVPISQPPPIPDRSPRRLQRTDAVVTPAARSQSRDDDDWVTIGDAENSNWEGELQNNMNGGARQTGSSIADTSDAGSLSMFTDATYDSSDRIAQHPAPVAGHSNYRMRDQTGKTAKGPPVLLPVYNQYRVNGFPANSSRLRPPQPVYQDPQPLQRRHNHPFRSPPPEVLSPTPPSRSRHFRSRHRNQFPPTTSTITSDGSGTTAHRADGHGRRLRRSNHNMRLSETHDWMRSTVSSRSMADRREFQSMRTINDVRPTSWGLVQGHANGGSMRGYTLRNGQIVPEGDQVDGMSTEHRADRIQGGYQGRDRLPPGTFYNNMRSGLATPRPVKPRRAAPGDFRYRSPLAPPRTQEARYLYSPSRLLELDDFAQRDGLRRAREVSATSEGPSQRFIHEAPGLSRFEDETLNPLQEEFLNRLCLALCSLFPPFLICFAVGAFDVLIEWRMKGRVRQFRSDYKRWAFLLFCLELAIVVITVAVVTTRTH
ncbi:hypothetical protein EG329_009439 [Mollisiaceae sp. DMI_Dod_QoI]|nr:hypothetical protein EG329_009439 [Helotiales sp. DMI_Dod_QoI]